jgi:hypothetical protein
MVERSDVYGIAALLSFAFGAPWWAWVPLLVVYVFLAAPRSRRPPG